MIELIGLVIIALILLSIDITLGRLVRLVKQIRNEIRTTMRSEQSNER